MEFPEEESYLVILSAIAKRGLLIINQYFNGKEKRKIIQST